MRTGRDDRCYHVAKDRTQADMATDKTLLVFNCHEPWIYQLGVLGYRLDIIVGLHGKYNRGWDERMRPIPARARLITLPQALESPTRYYCIVTHNTTDLLDARSRPEPRLLVLHHTLEGRLQEERSQIDPRELRHYAQILLADRELAEMMGRQARKTVAERFSLTRFKHAFLRSIEIARRKWYTRKASPASLGAEPLRAGAAGR